QEIPSLHVIITDPLIIGHDITVGQSQSLTISGINRITSYQIHQLINVFSDALRRLVSALLMYSFLDFASLLIQIFVLTEILNRHFLLVPAVN
ncbi:hypothetical protein CLOSYM_00622, partial [[Clostridium] symbiosum ATCC 14940]